MANEIADLKAHVAGLQKRQGELIDEKTIVESIARSYRALARAIHAGELTPAEAGQRLADLDKQSSQELDYEPYYG